MSTEELTSVRPPGRVPCLSCGTSCELVEEYGADIADTEIHFVAHRCPACGNEYMNAPEILRSDGELVPLHRPFDSPLGTYRRLLSLTSRDRGFRFGIGDNVAGTLLWYLLSEDLADVVFLAHQSTGDEATMAFTKGDLYDAARIRMGASRALVTGGGLRANLLTLTQLRNFARADRGLHPRIAVMGRPCQIYTMRKLLWDRFVPGYELAFALGTFCYGNFAPAGTRAQRLRDLLGFDPTHIRDVRYVGEELEFTSVQGVKRRVGQEHLAGLVNANCLQCYDFSVSFSDVSVGHIGAEEPFEVALVRTDIGETLLNQAIHNGFLAPSSQLYEGADIVEEERRALSFLNAMVDIKRELTRRVR